MIRLDDVWKSFDGRTALCGVTLHIDEGDAVLLTGPSGAGKSTLLRLIYAAEQPEQGRISVAGRVLGKLRASSIPYVRRNLGVVFQDFKLLPGRTVLENVSLTAEVLGLPRKEVTARARAALDAVGLSADAARLVRTLPGGLQQRVAVARALCIDPPILLCDEPTGNLDPLRARDLLELLEGIRGRGTTMLIATHDPTVVAFGMGHGWRKASLQKGEIVAGGVPAREALVQGEADVGIQVAMGDPLPPRIQSEATLRLLRDDDRDDDRGGNRGDGRERERDNDRRDGSVSAVSAESSLEVSIEIEMTAPSALDMDDLTGDLERHA